MLSEPNLANALRIGARACAMLGFFACCAPMPVWAAPDGEPGPFISAQPDQPVEAGTSDDASDPVTTITVLGKRIRADQAAASVIVISPDLIEDRRVQTLDDLAPLVPGLFLINDQDPGTNILNIRGVTTDRLQQAAVAYVLDQAVFGDTEFFTAPLFDVAQIEVARGPQGAAYGKNASGGILGVSNRAPSSEFSAFARLAGGNGGFREAEAAIGGAIGAGFRVRLAGLYRGAQGYIENDFLNRRVDGFDNGALRLSIAHGIGAWELTARLFFLAESGGAAYISSNNVTGNFGGRLAHTALTDPIGDFPGRADRQWGRYALNANRNFGDTKLSLVYSHDDYAKDFAEELDFRNGPVTFFGAPVFPDGIQPILQPVNLDVETFEARAEHQGQSRLSWRLGSFVQDVSRIRTDDFGPLQFGGPALRFNNHSTQFAFFGGLDIKANRLFTLSGDLRYDQDRRSQEIRATDQGGLVESRQAVFDRVQPRFSLLYQPDPLHPGNNFYLTYSEAFRTGGFNPLPRPTDIFAAQFAPEIARSLDGGTRFSWGGIDVTQAIYATQLRNYQNFTFLDGQSITLSIDRVRIWGLETSLQTPRFAGFAFTGSFALTNARITRFVSPDPLIAGATRDSSGNRVPNVPELTGTFSTDYRIELGPQYGTISLRADINLIGRTVFELDNVLFTPARASLDLRAQWQIRKLAIALWSKNAVDQRSAISAFGQNQLPLLQGLGPNGPFDSFTLNRGRSFGGEIRLSY